MGSDRTIYVLREDVRIFFSGDEEIRFRKGIWNFNEAVISLHGQSDSLKKFFLQAVDEFNSGGAIDAGKIAESLKIPPEELKTYQGILENIKAQGFLYYEDPRVLNKASVFLVGRTFVGLEEYITQAKPLLFFGDNKHIMEEAATVSKKINLPVDFLDEKIFNEIKSADLTDKMDAITHLKAIEKYEKYFAPYSAIIGSMIAPNISFLRNLNRILLRLEKPLVLGFVDGPFICILSIVVPQTACFECYEHRLLARMEDMAAYHKFAQASRNFATSAATTDSPVFTPVMNILTSAVLMEGCMFSTMNIMKLSGRVVHIYLPFLEIQVQDLLRVPYCPACGHIAMAKMDEMFTSSKYVIDQMLDTIHVK